MTFAWRLRLNGQVAALEASNVFGSTATLVSSMTSPTAAPRTGASANVRRPGPRRTSSAVASQVAVPAADRDRAPARRVTDGDGAALHGDQGAVAAIGRPPHGAANGSRCVATLGAKAPAAVAAPEAVAALPRCRRVGTRAAGEVASELQGRHAAE